MKDQLIDANLGEGEALFHRATFASLLLACLVALAAPAAIHGATTDQATIDRLHREQIERLKEAVGKYDQYSYAIHTLIVPPGAVADYNFPIPVTRIRYEAVPLFNFDDSQPRKEATPVISQLARQFTADTGLARIAIVGHTDSIGTDSYNYDLSLRRAWAVANLLRLHGVPVDKIVVLGLGASYPIATNQSAEGRAMNRRVEFFLSSIPAAIAPSIQNVPRNDEDSPCHNGNTPSSVSSSQDCDQGKGKQFPVQQMKPGGQLQPTGEVISTAGPPKYPVQEIPERVHVPMDVPIRPHVPD